MTGSGIPQDELEEHIANGDVSRTHASVFRNDLPALNAALTDTTTPLVKYLLQAALMTSSCPSAVIAICRCLEQREPRWIERQSGLILMQFVAQYHCEPAYKLTVCRALLELGTQLLDGVEYLHAAIVSNTIMQSVAQLIENQVYAQKSNPAPLLPKEICLTVTYALSLAKLQFASPRILSYLAPRPHAGRYARINGACSEPALNFLDSLQSSDREADLMEGEEAHVNACRYDGWSPLHTLALRQDNAWPLIQTLLQHKANPNSQTRAGMTPLALFMRKPALANQFLTVPGVDVNAGDIPPIHCADMQLEADKKAEQTALFRTLLERKA